ncbi:hypothetical protein BD410DRAFT_182075 [Rickenella mellea]|uniref:Protein kinase domain-containing protein n=1 Tax=Rickenella mellea TaxID=50990 RepID=A0A4Y7PHX9_9AGAM|nr:hypothetical protein BD410DRAFT_182075 [Rickenella mellea]
MFVGFFTCFALFRTHDNFEHLAIMEMVMGRMPDRFVRSGSRSKPGLFREGGRLDWVKPEASRPSKEDAKGTRGLQDLTPPKGAVNPHFLDLVVRSLARDLAQRISVRDALEHPYSMLNIAMEDWEVELVIICC